ncbi:MAG: HAD family hydrolase [Phycisphaerales bacterium]
MSEMLRHRTVSFDCYGTLVDWERGLLRALRPLVAAQVDDEAILGAFARAESELEAGPYIAYAEILAQVAERLGREFGFAVPAARRLFLAESLIEWPLFSDTLAAIGELREHCRVGILSNIDDHLIVEHMRRTGLRVDWIVTAQSCRSYKPRVAHFEEARRRYALGPDWVHAAQSLYHDIEPCRRLGIRCVWIDRRAGLSGGGATSSSTTVPDARCESLAELQAAVGVEP